MYFLKSRSFDFATPAHPVLRRVRPNRLRPQPSRVCSSQYATASLQLSGSPHAVRFTSDEAQLRCLLYLLGWGHHFGWAELPTGPPSHRSQLPMKKIHVPSCLSILSGLPWIPPGEPRAFDQKETMSFLPPGATPRRGLQDSPHGKALRRYIDEVRVLPVSRRASAQGG